MPDGKPTETDSRQSAPVRTPSPRRGRTPRSRSRTDVAAADSFDGRDFEETGEPLSLAEEIAVDLQRKKSVDDSGGEDYDRLKHGEVHIAELQKMSMSQLIDEARKDNVTEVAGMKKQDLIFNILKERVKMNGLMYGEGTLEILPDGFGFLRSPDYHYLSCPGRHLRIAQSDSPVSG